MQICYKFSSVHIVVFIETFFDSGHWMNAIGASEIKNNHLELLCLTMLVGKVEKLTLELLTWTTLYLMKHNFWRSHFIIFIFLIIFTIQWHNQNINCVLGIRTRGPLEQKKPLSWFSAKSLTVSCCLSSTARIYGVGRCKANLSCHRQPNASKNKQFEGIVRVVDLEGHPEHGDDGVGLVQPDGASTSCCWSTSLYLESLRWPI